MLAQTSYGTKGTYTVYVGRDTLETMRNMGFEFDNGRPVCHMVMNDGVVYLHKTPCKGSRRRYLSAYKANGDEAWTVGLQPNGELPASLRNEAWGRSEVAASHGTDFIRIPPPDEDVRRPAPVGRGSSRKPAPEVLPFVGEVCAMDGSKFSFGLNLMQGIRLREWLRDEGIEVVD